MQLCREQRTFRATRHETSPGGHGASTVGHSSRPGGSALSRKEAGAGCILKRCMVLPGVTEAPPAEGTDPWPTAEAALSAARSVARVAKEVYGEQLEEVWMFGSRARGDWRADSDLDLLILLCDDGDPRPKRWRYLPELREELIRRFEYITQDMISLRRGATEQMRSWDTTFYRSVRRDAVRVL